MPTVRQLVTVAVCLAAAGLARAQPPAFLPPPPGIVKTNAPDADDKDKKAAPEKRAEVEKKGEAEKKGDGDKKGEADKKKAEPLEKSWDVGSDLKMAGTWKNGLQFETPDKAFKFNVGGVIQFDQGFYGVDPAQRRSVGALNNLVDRDRTLEDGMDFRRARLRMGGLAWEQLEFFAQYEFANATDLRQRTLGVANPAGVANPLLTNTDPAETVGFNEVYVGLVKLPVVGNVRVGRHRESLNFVTATADNNQVWMERGLMFDAFNGNYNFSNGMTASRTFLDDDRAYALVGFFEQNSSSNRQFSTVGNGNYVYDVRLTGLPVWDEPGQRWVHVGVDYSYRNLNQNNVRIRSRQDIRVGSAFQVPSLVDTGTIFSNDAQQIANLELVSALGPWTLAAEGTVSTITNAFTGGLPGATGPLPAGVASRGTYVASGAYAEVLRFLTPDHRGYVKDRPGYARVTPSRRFFFLEGDDGRRVWDTGAWEVGVRYDFVNLSDAGINGGVAQGVTAAVNWYLTSNARVQVNYNWTHRGFPTTSDPGRLPGDVQALGIRYNCDF